MDERSLQTILREKYNIKDRLLAEGRFVGLIGDHAANLLCLGIGIRCLAIARVVLSGDVIDYELLSLVPLKVLSLSYQTLAKKIKIRSQFKAPQVYQLCTSANQAEVWDNFTSTIREVYMPEQGDIWCSPTLQPSKSRESTHTEGVSKTSLEDFEQQSVDISRHSSVSTMSKLSAFSFLRFDQRLSESSESLPAKLSSHADDNVNCLKDFERSQSMVNIGIQFESFVNDACPVSSGSSCNTLKYPYANDTDILNVSNNFIEVRDVSNEEIDNSKVIEGKHNGKLSRLFKKVFCCSAKSKR